MSYTDYMLQGAVVILILNEMAKGLGVNIFSSNKSVDTDSFFKRIFSKTKTPKKDKVKDNDPEETFNILEIDHNLGKVKYIELASKQKHGYVKNDNVSPIQFENLPKVDTPLKIFHKGLSRDITGFCFEADYTLNPSAVEMKRSDNMSIVRAFQDITKPKEDVLIKLCIILGVINLGFMYIVYKKVQFLGG